jgi:uncharacterized membrane protein
MTNASAVSKTSESTLGSDLEPDGAPGRLQYDEVEVSTADAPIGMLRDAKTRRAALREIGGWEDADIIERTISINRPRDELYAFWRNFENLPKFMENILRVDVLDKQRSHWVIAAPGDKTVEWDARIVIDDPGEMIAWQSEPGADIRNAGWLSFDDNPPGRGTAVSALILYDAPAGAIGKAIAALFQKEPGLQVRRDLRRFKQLMETGEIPTAEFYTPEGLVAAPRGSS